MKEQYKDTDLREALRRKYSDTPKLPADFMKKMAEQTEPPKEPKKAPMIWRWRWIAAAACVLLLVGVGIWLQNTSRPVDTPPLEGRKVDTPMVKLPSAEKLAPSEKHLLASKETTPSPKVSPSKVASSKTEAPSPSESIGTYRMTKDANLHYASQSLTEDSTYQAPSRMNEFIAKIADYNKVKAVPLECKSDNDDGKIVNTAYVFEDTKEFDLFARLLQAACWYDSTTPGYLLNFSHQQFFFTLKDLRKGEKYLWIAERLIGERILLFSAQSPIETNVSSACYQNYREQLTHNISTLDF